MFMTPKVLKSFLSKTGVAFLMLLFVSACEESNESGSPTNNVDTTGPMVNATVPQSAATLVALNSNIVVTFSEAMDPLTVTSATLTLQDGTSVIAGTVDYSGVTGTFNPTGDLDITTTYTVTVRVGATDLVGNALAADYVWSFTTGSTADTTAPMVTYTVPANDALDVVANRSIRANFSEAMNPNSLTAATFTVAGPDSTSIAGVVTYTASQATFTPRSALAIDTLFHVAITTGAKDLAGNALASNFEWNFTTGVVAAMGPDPVLLGKAGGFVILAKSGIDTIPTSDVTGNIGASPIDSTAITGFSLTIDATNEFATSDQVTGKVFAADYTSPTPAKLTTAISDMETAYTDAAGRVTPDFTELGAGEIGGLTLVPGLYKWGTGVSVSTDVILDGDSNDVWIFQIAGDVTQASSTTMTLSGGASPHNIFWQTFGQVMIGTTAHFEGIVLCQTTIVLETGASVNGRLLAQTAVTLDQNVVTQPALPSP